MSRTPEKSNERGNMLPWSWNHISVSDKKLGNHMLHSLTCFVGFIPTNWWNNSQPTKSTEFTQRCNTEKGIEPALANITRTPSKNFFQAATIKNVQWHTPPETNIAPARKPSQKETIVFQPSSSRCELLVWERVLYFCFLKSKLHRMPEQALTVVRFGMPTYVAGRHLKGAQRSRICFR